MDGASLLIYVSEVERQCRYALQALEASRAALEQLNVAGGPPDYWDRYRAHIHDSFRGVHSFLTHAANVSKLLKPANVQGGTKAERSAKQAVANTRGETLRQVLRLSQYSPLLNRDLRNRLDHFDEHLDAWVPTVAARGWIDHNITQVGGRSPSINADTVRTYIVRDREFICFGDRFDLGAMEEAVRALLPRAEAEIAQIRHDLEAVRRQAQEAELAAEQAAADGE